MAESMYSVQYHLKHLIPHYSKSSQVFFFPLFSSRLLKFLYAYMLGETYRFFFKKLHVSDIWTVRLAHSAAKQAEGKKKSWLSHSLSIFHLCFKNYTTITLMNRFIGCNRLNSKIISPELDDVLKCCHISKTWPACWEVPHSTTRQLVVMLGLFSAPFTMHSC